MVKKTMKKKKPMIQRLIDGVYERYSDIAKSLKALQIEVDKPVKANADVQYFLDKLKAAGFRELHVYRSLRFEIRFYETGDRAIEVHLHRNGDLYRVYEHLNDNNLASLFKRITEPDFRVIKAREFLNESLKVINGEGYQDQLMNPLLNQDNPSILIEHLKLCQQDILLHEKNIQNAANQLALI